MTTASAIGTSSTGANMGWSTASFREKFGSLFESDNQKRLDEVFEADMARNSANVNRRFKVADAKIAESKTEDLRALGIERRPATQAISVAQSFDAPTGAQFKAMALRV